MNKMKLLIGFIFWFLLLPNFYFTLWLKNQLPYCVTHLCGCTHSLCFADIVWWFYPLGSMIVIFFIGLVLIISSIEVE
jgi:hypothetical protein